MKVIVNRALCDGNGNCAREAPHVFAMDEDDCLLQLKEEVDVCELDRVRAAVRACPKGAICIVD